MRKTYKFVVAYDGASFTGWQCQRDQHTVAGFIEQALSVIALDHSKIAAAGRTDSGVHALGQVISVDADIRVPVSKLCRVMNQKLPDAIRILKAEQKPASFHARFSAKARAYVYWLAMDTPPVFLKRYVGTIDHLPPIQIGSMKQAARLLIGEKYLKAFCTSGSESTSFYRNVHGLTVSVRKLTHPWGGDPIRVIQFTIKANAFLYRMVRNVVGALLEVGCGSLSVSEFEKIVNLGDRKRFGKPVPPQGLYLKKVYY